MKNLFNVANSSFRRLLVALMAPCLLLGQSPAGAQALLDRLQGAAAAGSAAAEARPARLAVDHVEASLSVGQTQVAAGEPLQVLLSLAHAPGWHTYWRNPGDAGLPTQISLRLGDQLLPIESRQWPVPERHPVGSLASYGYEGLVTLGASTRLPADLRPGRHLLEVDANWLVCREVCIPGEARLGLEIEVVAADGPAASTAAQSPQALEAVARLMQTLPRASQEGLGYAVLADEKRLQVWGRGMPPAPGGYLFVEQESLVLPSAAQALYATAEGWLLEMPLAETPAPGLRALDAAQQLRAVWRPAQRAATESAGLEWAFLPGTPPVKAGMVSPGFTAQEVGHAASPEGGALSAWSFWVALAGAFVGGLILNLMPCVFPVLGLKVLSLSAKAHTGRPAWGSALLFTAGVWLSMLALAGLMLALRAAGETLGWGFQLQNPVVVTGLALLFLAIALNLFGVYEFGGRLTQLGSLDRGQGPWSAFGSGVLAVVVASPCTAPFMGGALGFTLTATTAETLAIFSSLGLGLAAPFALLSLRPAALAWLPKPGPWMDDFRRFLAFPMLATVAWLSWVLAVQRGGDVVLPLLLGMVFLSLGLWLHGQGQQAGPRPISGRSMPRLRSVIGLLLRLAIWLGGLFLLAQAAGLWSVTAPPVSPGPLAPLEPKADQQAGSNAPLDRTQAREAPGAAGVVWRPWEPGLPERLSAEGKVVFVDFTAAWCISCQVNKLRVLQTSPVAEALTRPEVVALVADWTSRDSAITQELARFGRSGVPVYLVYPAGGSQPRLLSEWLSSEEVMTALAEAGLR